MNIWFVGQCLSGVFLACAALPDIRFRKIPLVIPAVFGAAAVCMQVFMWSSGEGDLIGTAVGLLPCIVAAVLCLCTDSVGMGDVLCLLVLALSEKSCICSIFLGALFFMSIFGIALLLMRRADRRTRLPFIPFLFLSQIIYCAMRWRESV